MARDMRHPYIPSTTVLGEPYRLNILKSCTPDFPHQESFEGYCFGNFILLLITYHANTEEVRQEDVILSTRCLNFALEHSQSWPYVHPPPPPQAMLGSETGVTIIVRFGSIYTYKIPGFPVIMVKLRHAKV